MAAAKDELANLDEDWEEPPALAQAETAAVRSVPPDLGDLDDGWNADSSPSAASPSEQPARRAMRASTDQESVPVPSVKRLTKRQRRELARQQRRHATQRRSERKKARKLERREQAKQRAAERPSSVVVRVAAKDAEASDGAVRDTRAARTGGVAFAALTRTDGEARRAPASTSAMARPERRARPQRSVLQETQRVPARAGPVRVAATAGRERKTSWALYWLGAAVVAALAVWAWLR